MINLPRFTFLCGSLGQGQGALIRALCAQDDNLLRIDLTCPIHEMIVQLFPDSMPVTVDPTEHLDLIVAPGFSDLSVRHLFFNLIDCLRNTFGTKALGNLSHRTIVANDTIRLFERLVFSDCLDREDADVFIEEYGGENCLAVFLGDLLDIKARGLNTIKCRQIWLPLPDTKKRLELLNTELSKRTTPYGHITIIEHP